MRSGLPRLGERPPADWNRKSVTLHDAQCKHLIGVLVINSGQRHDLIAQIHRHCQPKGQREDDDDEQNALCC